MSSKSRRQSFWRIGAPSHYFEKHFKYYPQHTKYIPEFETDVTKNPFYHQKPSKITKIEQEINRYQEESYRWSKRDLRIIYFPNKEDHTVYPLDAAMAGSVKYKKRR